MLIEWIIKSWILELLWYSLSYIAQHFDLMTSFIGVPFKRYLINIKECWPKNIESIFIKSLIFCKIRWHNEIQSNIEVYSSFESIYVTVKSDHFWLSQKIHDNLDSGVLVQSGTASNPWEYLWWLPEPGLVI